MAGVKWAGQAHSPDSGSGFGGDTGSPRRNRTVISRMSAFSSFWWPEFRTRKAGEGWTQRHVSWGWLERAGLTTAGCLCPANGETSRSCTPAPSSLRPSSGRRSPPSSPRLALMRARRRLSSCGFWLWGGRKGRARLVTRVVWGPEPLSVFPDPRTPAQLLPCAALPGPLPCEAAP